MIFWSPSKLKLTLGIGTLALAAMSPELVPEGVSPWWPVAVVSLPIAAFLFSDEFPPKWMDRIQRLASIIYLALVVVCLILVPLRGMHAGHLVFYCVCLVVGAIPCVIVLFDSPPRASSLIVLP